MEDKIIALMTWIVIASITIFILGIKADNEMRVQLFIVLIISILIAAFKVLFS